MTDKKIKTSKEENVTTDEAGNVEEAEEKTEVTEANE